MTYEIIVQPQSQLSHSHSYSHTQSHSTSYQMGSKAYFYYTAISETMANTSSFLENNSFFSPPPLRKVEDSFNLDKLCTIGLGETKGVSFEFGNTSCIT